MIINIYQLHTKFIFLVILSNLAEVVFKWTKSKCLPDGENDPIIGPKIRKELGKTGCQVVFTAAAKLKNTLCNTKSKLLPNSYPSVYKSSCDCRGRGTFDKQKKHVLTWSIKHQEDSMTGKWEASGATEHSKDCHGRFNWLFPKRLAKLPNIHKRKIRESRESKQFRDKSRIWQIHQSVE